MILGLNAPALAALEETAKLAFGRLATPDHVVLDRPLLVLDVWDNPAAGLLDERGEVVAAL